MKTGKDPFVPNPILGGLVGVFPLAAAAYSLANGLVLGLGAALCSIALASLMPALRAIAPDRLRAPLSLGISAALALLYSDLIALVAPVTGIGLGVYLPLLAVNSMSMHILRGGHTPLLKEDSATSRMIIVLREAMGFFLVALLIGAVREAAGFGTLVFPAVFANGARLVLTKGAPLLLLASPAGGFILIGCSVALYRVILRKAARRIP